MLDQKWTVLLFALVTLVFLANICDAKKYRTEILDDVPLKNGDDQEMSGRERVFSLFSIVTFSNTGCRSSSGTTGSGVNRNGTCYTTTECTDKGGSASGNCAAGFGVCCLFVVSAGSSTISENCTYIQNPSFPSVYSSTTALTYTVSKCSTDVCTLRFDFETFAILGPTADTAEANGGACSDTFQVTGGSSQSTPVICGSNAGSHIYYDIGAGSTTATISFTFSSTTSTTRTWEIKVTQIECSNQARPFDTGCLQYYTGSTGRITSFNFLDDSSTQAHLASQTQVVCIRPSEGNCCVRYIPCTDTNSFTIDQNANPGTAMLDAACSEDYVGIAGALAQCALTTSSVTHTRFCGGIFSFTLANTVAVAEVCDCSAPFTVDIITDNSADTIASATIAINRGVCLNYVQQSCALS